MNLHLPNLSYRSQDGANGVPSGSVRVRPPGRTVEDEIRGPETEIRGPEK
jgi:hypothetical protein